MKIKISKWDLINPKSFYTAKDIMNKMKRQPSEWENIFANKPADKGLISKINSSCSSMSKKQTTQSKNGHKTKIDISPKKTYRWLTNT